MQTHRIECAKKASALTQAVSSAVPIHAEIFAVDEIAADALACARV